MSSKLPTNLENLLLQRQVKGERIEYKAGWDLSPRLPDKPNNRLQKYRIEAASKAWISAHFSS